MSPLLVFYLVVHARDNVRQPSDCLQYIPWLGEIVVITPVKSHGTRHLTQVIHWGLSVLVMLNIKFVTSPVKGVETSSIFLLSIVEDGVSGGACRGVVENVRKQGRVQLALVKPT